MTTNRKELLKLFRDNTGKTIVEVKPEEPKNPVPYQTAKVIEYQMTGRRGN
jgi:hypothetical protein